MCNFFALIAEQILRLAKKLINTGNDMIMGNSQNDYFLGFVRFRLGHIICGKAG